MKIDRVDHIYACPSGQSESPDESITGLEAHCCSTSREHSCSCSFDIVDLLRGYRFGCVLNVIRQEGWKSYSIELWIAFLF